MPAFAAIPRAIPRAVSRAVSRSAARLRELTWIEQLQQAYLVFIGASLLMLLLPAAIKHALRPLYLAAPFLPLIAKDLAHLPDAAARVRGTIAARAWLRLPKALLHPEQLGMLRLDRALRRGFAGWLLRRPQAAAPAGTPFTYLERGAYRTACAFLLFTALVELPLDAAILPLLPVGDGERTAIHLLMFASAVSAIVYMLGDRWLIGAGRHVLTERSLELRVGARTHGAVPLDAIAGCERIKEPAAAWLRRHGIPRRHAVLASPLPLDKPNAVLILTADSRVRLTHLGVERAGLSCIFLYLDDPQDLVDTLAAR